MDKEKIIKVISGFEEVTVLVIGDLMLDEFVWGKVSRISPEAPVPVVWVDRESFILGGAGNVASNVCALSGKVLISGVIGDDARAGLLKNKIKEKGIDIGGLVVDLSRPTTVKTRVIAHHQQVVRIDREDVAPLNDKLILGIIDYVEEKIQDVDAVIIEDYGKGVVCPELVQKVKGLCKKYERPLVVDPKEEHFSYYKGVTALTPNQDEAGRAAGVVIKDFDTLKEAGKRLKRELECKGVLITLGENGMCLFESQDRFSYIPTVAQDVFDVSGAGDTVVASFVLSLVSGASMTEAACISNYTAGIVVGKVGVAVATRDELDRRITSGEDIIEGTQEVEEYIWKQ